MCTRLIKDKGEMITGHNQLEKGGLLEVQEATHGHHSGK